MEHEWFRFGVKRSFGKVLAGLEFSWPTPPLLLEFHRLARDESVRSALLRLMNAVLFTGRLMRWFAAGYADIPGERQSTLGPGRSDGRRVLLQALHEQTVRGGAPQDADTRDPGEVLTHEKLPTFDRMRLMMDPKVLIFLSYDHCRTTLVVNVKNMDFRPPSC